MGSPKWESMLTKEYLVEMCKIYTKAELTAVTGVPQTTLANYLKKYGLLPALVDRNQRSFAEILTKEFLTTVYPGKTFKEIAKIAGCSPKTVDKYLAKHGLYHLKKIRRGGSKKSVAEILTFDYLKSVHLVKTTKEIAIETGCGLSTVRKYLHGFSLSLKNSRLGKMRGSKNPNWKGGHSNNSGYRFIHCPRIGKPRREHLVIMEEHIGRPMDVDEVVHHCNGVRDDNSIDNLLLMKRNSHDTFHSICKTFIIDYSTFTKEDVLYFLNKVEKVCNKHRL